MSTPLPAAGAAPPGAGLRARIAPIAAITVFGLALSMSLPLLALLLERGGASGLAIGFNTMATSVAMVVFAPLLPRIMASVGMGRLILGAGAGLAVLLLAFPLLPDYWAWTALRLVFGFCGTAVFFASEYWIVAAAHDGNRGRVVALYTISLSVSFMLGPLLLRLTGVEGLLPFAIAAAVILAGLLPVVWGYGAIPPARPEAPPRPAATLRFFVTDPVLLWGVVLFGMLEYGSVALLPVWAVRAGFEEGDAVVVMASFAAGAVIMAPLLGWASDRWDRRRLLALVGLMSVIAPSGIALAAPGLAGVLGFGMLWGGMAVGLYSIALTELGARYSGARLAEGNAAVILAYGIGALASPAVLGLAMDLVPPDGLLWVSSAAALAYVALTLARMALRARKPLDTPGEPGR